LVVAPGCGGDFASGPLPGAAQVLEVARFSRVHERAALALPIAG